MNKKEAEKLLEEAYEKRILDGVESWIAHSTNVAYVAEKLGELSGLDPEKSYIMGLLHDIGRGQDRKIRHKPARSVSSAHQRLLQRSRSARAHPG